MKCAVFLVALCIAVSSGNSANAQRYKQYVAAQVVPYVVKEQQVILPLPVNPYYFSYNALVANTNAMYAPPQQLSQNQIATAPQQAQNQTAPVAPQVTDNTPMTRGEFREFAEMLIAALENRDNQQYLKETGQLNRLKVIPIMEANCKSCHSQPPEGRRPQFYNEGRLLSDDQLNWVAIDHMTRARLMPPKDHGTLADTDLYELSKHANEVWMLQRQKAVTQPQQQPPPQTEVPPGAQPPPDPMPPTPPMQNPNPRPGDPY